MRALPLRLLAASLVVAACACGEDGSSSGGAPPAPTPRLELGLLHLPAPLPDGGFPDLGAAGEPRRFANDRGQSIELEAGELSLTLVELRPCDDAAAGAPLLFEDTDDIVARADLVAATKTYEVPARPVCAVRLTLGPTTLFGDDRPTFAFRGRCAGPSGERAFDVASSDALERELGVIARDADGVPVPALLDPTSDAFARSEDDDAVPDLLYALRYTALFDGIDCVGASEAELVAHVAGRLAGAAFAQHTSTLRGFEEL